VSKEKRRILVADDDAFIRRPLEWILLQEGFNAETAADGDECMEMLRNNPPDLLILDVMMPGLDGFEICRRIKDDSGLREIPVILLSARGREHDRERGMALGAAEYLTKPYSPTDLMQRIRGLLETCAAGGTT
jgi:DNA-binding response OmpR family regulator